MVKSVIKKMLEEAAAKKNERPVLKCIHYENGGAVATDSHRLVKFNNINNNKDLTASINASTLLPCNDKYPRTDFLIPSIDDSQVKLTLDGNAVDVLVGFLKDNRKTVVTFNISSRDDINLTNKTGEKLHIETKNVDYNLGDQFDGKPILLSASYLYESLRYITKLRKEWFNITSESNLQQVDYSDDITITFNGHLRPILITFLNMQYVIRPCARYDTIYK